MEEYKKLTYTNVPNPVISGPDEILVRVRATAICGSDIHGFDGSTGRRKPPIIMGHEAAGEVVTAGGAVTKFHAGDRITFDSTIYCGGCYFCRNGQVNLCDNRMVLGVSCDEYRRYGTFAEYVVVPERICYSLPDSISNDEAAMTEPAAVAAHAVRITPIGLNESIGIVGTGLIGLLLLEILKASVSGPVFAFDTDPVRREQAKVHGADFVFNPADRDLNKKIPELTEGRGLDRVFEAVGASVPIQTAISVVRKGGSVTLIGNVSPKIDIPLQSVVSRQISLLGSCAINGEYPIVLDLMAKKKINVESLISKKAPLYEGQDWFNKLYNREDNLLKVILMP